MFKYLLGIFISAFLIALPTMPLVFWIFGFVGLKIYGQFVLPELAIIGYVVYLLVQEELC
jgi:hypothetical protein